MGVTLTYQPLEESPRESRTEIIEEAQRIAEDREWWCEPLYFMSGEILNGATKIFLPGYSTGDGGVNLSDVAILSEEWLLDSWP